MARVVDERLVLEGWRRLGLAVLVRSFWDLELTGSSWSVTYAAKEAGIPAEIGIAGDARAFLEGPGARWLVRALDLDAGSLARALEACEPAEWGQLSFEIEDERGNGNGKCKRDYTADGTGDRAGEERARRDRQTMDQAGA